MPSVSCAPMIHFAFGEELDLLGSSLLAPSAPLLRNERTGEARTREVVDDFID